MTTERAPFKSSVTDFTELRKRREELFPPANGVEPQPAPPPATDTYDDYDYGCTPNPKAVGNPFAKKKTWANLEIVNAALTRLGLS